MSQNDELQDEVKVVAAQAVPELVSGPTGAAPVDEMTGQVVAGKFEILSQIGSGGMSIVYKARHLQLAKVVALKILKSSRLQNAKDIQRFQKEAQAATALNHPNIVGVREFGLDDSSHPYIVMDYVDGSALSDLIKDKALSCERALQIGSQLCAALAHAHEKGIVHRDMKPENVLIGRSADGSELPMIVDFGIARIIDEEQRSRLTQTGEVFGTPAYMSPEQSRGNPVDRKSDIYSLGCMLYEMLSGRQPFQADSPLVMLMKHNSETPAPIEGVSAEIQSVLFKAMEKDPLNRFESAAAMNLAIESLATSKAPVLNLPEWNYCKILALRAAAWLIDLLIVSAPAWIIASLIAPGLSNEVNRTLSLSGLCEQCMPGFGLINMMYKDSAIEFILLALLVCIFNYLYHALWESSKKQATPGKQLAGLLVSNTAFGRLSFRQASYRHWAKSVYFALYLLITGIGPRFLKFTEWWQFALAAMFVLIVSAVALRKQYQMVHDAIVSAKVIPAAHSPSAGTPSLRAAFFCALLLSIGLLGWGINTDLQFLGQTLKYEKLLEESGRISSLAEAQRIYFLAREAEAQGKIETKNLRPAFLLAGNKLLASGHSSDAEKIYKLAFGIAADDVETRIQMARAYQEQCLQKRRDHSYAEAEQAGFRSLALWSLLSETKGGMDEELYNSLSWMGWLYSDQKMPEKALVYFNKALELEAVQKSEVRKALVFLDISGAYLGAGMIDRSQEYCAKAAAAAERAGDKHWQGIALALEANCLNYKKKLPEAHQLCLRAKELLEKNKPRWNPYAWYAKFYTDFAKSILLDNKVEPPASVEPAI